MNGGCLSLDPTCIYLYGKFESTVWGRSKDICCMFVWVGTWDLGVRTIYTSESN